MNPSANGRLTWSPEQVEALRRLVKVYYLYQEEELRLRGVMGIKKDDTPKRGSVDYDKTYTQVISDRIDDIVQLVEGVEKQVKGMVHTHALWVHFLKGVKGCGEMMAAVILTEIDVNRAETVSKIWQFAGMNPGQVPGKVWKGKGAKRRLQATDKLVRGDRRTEGFVRPYNQFLKDKLLGVLAGCFHKSRSDYLVYYRNYRQRLESAGWGNESKNPTDPDNPRAGHQHLASNRYMIKMFIRDLYEAWRKLEGLPVRCPYQEEYLNHKHGGKGHEPPGACPNDKEQAETGETPRDPGRAAREEIPGG